MSKLNDFLNPVQTKKEKKIIISDRFVERDEEGNILHDEKGDPILHPFTIRSISQEENEMLLKRAKRIEIVNGQKQTTTDSTAYSRALVVAATVDPDFSSKEVCDHFGTLDPTQVPAKMLWVGEYAKLLREIVSVSGLDSTEVEEELKN